MKPDKRKFIVIGMLLVVIAFIVIYSMSIVNDEPSDTEILTETDIPELKGAQKEYDSRLEAVDKLSEKKPLTPPGLYDEDLIDDKGTYDPYLEEKEKVAMMDSILALGPDMEDYQEEGPATIPSMKIADTTYTIPYIKLSDIGHGHSNFFLTETDVSKPTKLANVSPIRVVVNGDQVVRKDERLELRLIDPLVIEEDTIPGNTLLYAFCSFQPNRLLLRIHEVGKRPIELEAYDISDGQKGIYIENSFRSQAATEVIDDVIQDINVSGVPQVSGLKGIFQRSNRSIKVKVLHQYQLYLKPVL